MGRSSVLICPEQQAPQTILFQQILDDDGILDGDKLCPSTTLVQIMFITKFANQRNNICSSYFNYLDKHAQHHRDVNRFDKRKR